MVPFSSSGRKPVPESVLTLRPWVQIPEISVSFFFTFNVCFLINLLSRAASVVDRYFSFFPEVRKLDLSLPVLRNDSQTFPPESFLAEILNHKSRRLKTDRHSSRSVLINWSQLFSVSQAEHHCLRTRFHPARLLYSALCETDRTE